MAMLHCHTCMAMKRVVIKAISHFPRKLINDYAPRELAKTTASQPLFGWIISRELMVYHISESRKLSKCKKGDIRANQIHVHSNAGGIPIKSSATPLCPVLPPVIPKSPAPDLRRRLHLWGPLISPVHHTHISRLPGSSMAVLLATVLWWIMTPTYDHLPRESTLQPTGHGHVSDRSTFAGPQI